MAEPLTSNQQLRLSDERLAKLVELTKDAHPGGMWSDACLGLMELSNRRAADKLRPAEKQERYEDGRRKGRSPLTADNLAARIAGAPHEPPVAQAYVWTRDGMAEATETEIRCRKELLYYTRAPVPPSADREDMENIGRAFMESLRHNLPKYSWAQCPSEVICDLINERDEARAQVPPSGLHEMLESAINKLDAFVNHGEAARLQHLIYRNSRELIARYRASVTKPAARTTCPHCTGFTDDHVAGCSAESSEKRPDDFHHYADETSGCLGCEKGWAFDSELGVHQDPNTSTAIKCTAVSEPEVHRE